MTGGTPLDTVGRTFGFLGNKLGLYRFSLYMLSVFGASDVFGMPLSFDAGVSNALFKSASASFVFVESGAAESSSSSFDISITSPSCLGGGLTSPGLGTKAARFGTPGF